MPLLTAAVAFASLREVVSVASCTLQASGPVTVQADGEVVENLLITSNSASAGIMVQGHKNVKIRNVKIVHRGGADWPYGAGIYFEEADGITIDGVDVELVGQSSGPLPDWHSYNIIGHKTPAPRVSNVRVTGGSTGVEFDHCNGGVVSHMVAKNVRGPFPHGQCFQASQSDDVLLEDFYCQNDETAWTEDTVSVWRSSNATIRRGLVDGNNSPTGVGVMMEQDDASKSGGLIEDVDTIHQGDGCFSAYGARDITFSRVRCRDNHCDGWSGRDKPTSNSLLFAAGDEHGCTCSNIRLKEGAYFNACNPGNLFWEMTPGAWAEKDLSEVDFTPRTPVSVSLCFDEENAQSAVV